jgi:hypothetical protein
MESDPSSKHPEVQVVEGASFSYSAPTDVDVEARQHARCFSMRWTDWYWIKRIMKRVHTPPP